MDRQHYFHQGRPKEFLFNYDVSPDLPKSVRADDKRLGQLLNLLGNAIKFTDRGEVRLQVQRLSGSSTMDWLRLK